MRQRVHIEVRESGPMLTEFGGCVDDKWQKLTRVSMEAGVEAAE